MVTTMAEFAVLCLFLLVTTQCRAQEIDDWTQKCNKCKCVWSSGKKTADCTDINLNNIPSDLSTQIREMDFSLNPIYELGVKIFIKNKIRDVHKLRFQNCSLESIDKTAFEGVCLLIELDLSRNNLKEIDKETFRDTLKMRILNLSFNKLTRLESGLLYNMTHLQRISLNDNQISWMGQTVFEKLPALQNINLGNNRLETVLNDFTKNLEKLNSLNVEGNPWICDCNLEQFRRKTLRENWITTPTSCSEPPRLRGRLWSGSDVFACAPTIIEPEGMTSLEVSTTNVTLTCKVTGQPLPDVDWVTNGRIIARDPRQSVQRYVLSKNIEGNFTWNNLTIINVGHRDRGEYKCLAKNPGGTDEHNLTLIVSSVLTHSAGVSNIMKPIEGYIPIIVGVLLALLFLFIIISFLMFRCRRSSPRNGTDRKGGDNESSSEYINLHGQPDLEKSLITDVNPVVKPPRFVMPTPMSMSSGGTEVSDAKRNLLDSDSVNTYTRLLKKEELKKYMKRVMPFVQTIREKLQQLGPIALAKTLEFYEAEVLKSNSLYLANTLDVDEVIVKFTDDPTATDKMKECCPGSPFVVFSTKSGVKIEFVNPVPSSGLFSLKLPVLDGDTLDVKQRLSKSVRKIESTEELALWRYEDPVLGPLKIPGFNQPTKDKVLIETGSTFKIDEAAKKVLVVDAGKEFDLGNKVPYLLG